MQFSLDNGTGLYKIRGYNSEGINVNGQKHPYSILIMPDLLIAPWEPETVTALLPNHFASLLGYEPQVILLGTGPKLQRPPIEVFLPLIEANQGFEIMDTAAACRTYMLLMAEGRRVVAGLLFS
jgi:uncharacterized protein